MAKPVTFLVIDDHPVFRQGLVALIKSSDRYQVCGEAGSAPEALEALQHTVPDIALVDISLVGQNGLDLVRSLKASHPSMLILIISMHDEVVYAERALKAGARGYVMKQEAASVMLDAIQTVLSGKIYVSAAMRDRLLETMFNRREDEAPTVERLSDRELEVLERIGQGYGTANSQLLGQYIFCASQQPNFRSFASNLNSLYSGSYVPGPVLSNVANFSGLNYPALTSCIGSSMSAINAQALLASYYNITQTPLVVVNCQYLAIPQTAPKAFCYNNSTMC